MWKHNNEGQQQCTVCDYRGNQGDVIIHFLHQHWNEDTVPYRCVKCGCQVTHRRKAWWHRTKFHGCPEDGPLTDTFQGSFVDLPVQCIAKEVEYLEHPWAINIKAYSPQYVNTPASESECVWEQVYKKPCRQNYGEEEALSVSDISSEQKNVVEAVLKGAEIAKHQGVDGSGDDDEAVSLKSDHSTSWKCKRYK